MSRDDTTPEWIAQAVKAWRDRDYPRAIAAALIHCAEVLEDVRWAFPADEEEIEVSKAATLEDDHDPH